MKKFSASILSLVTLLIVILSACSSDDTITGEPQPINSDAAKSYTLTISANKGDSSIKSRMTRALELSSDGMEISATWNEGDEVTVYNTSSNPNTPIGKLTAQSSGESTILKGTLTGNISVGDELVLRILPDNGNIYDQEGTFDYISNWLDCAEAWVQVKSVDASGNITPEADVTEFSNLYTIVRFTLVDNDDVTTRLMPTHLDITVGEPDDVTTYSLNDLDYGTYMDNSYAGDDGDGVLYVLMESINAEDITLTATTEDGDVYTYSKSGVTLEQARFYSITVKMIKEIKPTITVSDSDGNILEPDGFKYNLGSNGSYTISGSSGDNYTINAGENCTLTFKDGIVLNALTITTGEIILEGNLTIRMMLMSSFNPEFYVLIRGDGLLTVGGGYDQLVAGHYRMNPERVGLRISTGAKFFPEGNYGSVKTEDGSSDISYSVSDGYRLYGTNTPTSPDPPEHM